MPHAAVTSQAFGKSDAGADRDVEWQADGILGCGTVWRAGPRLRRGMALAIERGYALSNADITVVCERPKVAPHVEAMRRNLAADLGCAVGDVSVKATTSEKLGFTGRGEGIAAFAVVLLHRHRASATVAPPDAPALETFARRFEPDERE